MGAMWVPGDGVCHPYKLTRSLMQIANDMGQSKHNILNLFCYIFSYVCGYIIILFITFELLLHISEV